MPARDRRARERAPLSPNESPSRPSADQNGYTVHGIATVTLRVPVASNVWLKHAARVRCPCPHLVVTIAGQFQCDCPALPVVVVPRLAEVGTLPAHPEI